MEEDGGHADKRARRPGLRRVVLEDLRRKDLKHSLRRDLRSLYRFYVDADKREILRKKSPLIRWVYPGVWLARGLILNLSPVRRLLLLAGLVLAVAGNVTFTRGSHTFQFNLLPWAILILLVILMLELKDKMLFSEELKIGRAIQVALLPDQDPDLPGWEIHLYSKPANEVCGDLVDFITVNGGAGVVLADVSGHGLGAALLMAKLQATLRALCAESTSLSEMGARLNRIISRDSPTGTFATMTYVEISPDSGRVRVLNAGHIPPVVIRGNTLERLQPQALPIGIWAETEFTEETVDLAPGDVLVAYSDGLSEARDRSGEMFGDQRVDRLLADGGPTAGAIGSRLLGAAAAFMGDEPPEDDLSLVLLRRLG
jgi:sigma-B regulation protein RsbU (phosphoserine phosphatase)